MNKVRTTLVGAPALGSGDELHRSPRTLVFRATTKDGLAAVVKMPATPIPTAEELIRYQREADTLQRVAGAGVPELLGLVARQGTTQLWLADTGARSLEASLDALSRGAPGEGRFAIDDVMIVLAEASAVLERVHAAGIVHRDVSPANLVWSGRAGTVQLVDFGLSAPPSEAPSGVEGTLHTVAPELTGHRGGRVDARADLYSLGATAWRLLIGRPPFDERDPLALVHAHLAQTPLAPSALRPEVPETLSAIVMRLMEKDPNRRYQTAAGLRADVRRLLTDPGPFPLGEEDAPDRLELPDRLFGRAAELDALDGALARAAAGERVFVTLEGPTGIGKSSLVAELARRAGTVGARVGRGRCEFLERDEPMQALREAIESVLEVVLAEPDEVVERLVHALREALGEAAAVLTETLPSLATLLGVVGTAPDVPPDQGALRADLAHAALLRTLATPETPLVLFLDDMQWAEPQCIELVRFLITDRSLSGLLVMVGFRGDEVDERHPLRSLLGLADPTPVRVRVGPLAQLDARAWVAATLGREPDDVAPLADMLHVRSGGNPFVLRTNLEELHRERLVRRMGGRWDWEPAAFQRIALAEDVVDLLVRRMARLSPDAHRTLGVAALLGHRFDPALLATVLERPIDDVLATLRAALDAELLIAGGPTPSRDGDPQLALVQPPRVLEFAHDRVHEAAAVGVPAEARPGLHLRAGRELLRPVPASEPLDIIGHYRHALYLVGDDAERFAVADQAALAAAHAVRSGVLRTALMAYEVGMGAVGTRDAARWESLCAGAIGVAEAQHDDDAMNRHADALIHRARTLAAKAPAYQARITNATRASRLDQALDHADAFLIQTGERVPRRFRPFKVLGLLIVVLWHMLRRSPERLVALPVSEDPLHHAITDIRMLSNLPQIALAPAGAVEGMLRDLRGLYAKGLSRSGPMAWSAWGILLTRIGKVRLARRFGELSVSQSERFERGGGWSVAAMAHHVAIRPCTHTLAETIVDLLATARRGFDAGSWVVANGAMICANILRILSGRPVGEVLEAVRSALSLSERLDDVHIARFLVMMEHALMALRGEAEVSSPSEKTEQDVILGRYAACLQVMLALFLQRDDPRAVAAAARTPLPGAKLPLRTPDGVGFWTYKAVLAQRALAMGVMPKREAHAITRAARRALRGWVRAVPTHAYRLAWIEAARHAASGKSTRVVDAYVAAIALARASGDVHDAACMAEHAAVHAAAQGHPDLARALRSDAAAGYRQWGAGAVHAKLVAAFPDVADAPEARDRIVTVGSDSSGRRATVDLPALTAAAASLDATTPEGRDALVALAMRATGAERGGLVRRVPDGWQRVDGLAHVDLPESVLRAVTRTQQPLCLRDARADPAHGRDPTVVRAQVRSVVCVPVGDASALYLENNLVIGAFGAHHLEALAALGRALASAV